MARVLRAIGSQTYVIVPGLVPAKIHPLDLLRLLARILATGMGCRKYGPDGGAYSTNVSLSGYCCQYIFLRLAFLLHKSNRHQ